MTPKQKRFVEEYLIDLNATQAAIRAGYSKKTAQIIGFENLNKPIIADAIGFVLDERSKETKIDAAWVLKRAALLADFNLNRFLTVTDEGQAIFDFTNATDDDWFCISEYTADMVSRGSGDLRVNAERVKLKTFDRLRALELVGKHVDVNAFKDRIEHTGPGGGPMQLINTDMTTQQAIDAYKDTLHDG